MGHGDIEYGEGVGVIFFCRFGYITDLEKDELALEITKLLASLLEDRDQV